MNWLKENKLIVILLIIILGFAFYWYEWRPAQIRKECARKSSQFGGGFLEQQYKSCLVKQGLEK